MDYNKRVKEMANQEHLDILKQGFKVCEQWIEKRRGRLGRFILLKSLILPEKIRILISYLFIETNLSGADLTGCFIHGISVWNVQLDETIQRDLVITRLEGPTREPTITVDNLELAQFIYLLLDNKKIGYAIDTITSKVVLILGR